jgi:hypothetical protein
MNTGKVSAALGVPTAEIPIQNIAPVVTKSENDVENKPVDKDATEINTDLKPEAEEAFKQIGVQRVEAITRVLSKKWLITLFCL